MATSYTSHSDEDLYTAMSGGNKDAFVELYGRYRSRIYAYALRMLGDRDRAADVFQETFTRIYRSCSGGEQMRVMDNVQAYIFTTARNICLNVIRNSKTTVAVEDYHRVVFQPSHENRELVELVTRSLELLPEHLREAFVLREYDGLSYQEISDITGQTMSAVKVHIFRAKERLRRILAPYLEEAGSAR